MKNEIIRKRKSTRVFRRDSFISDEVIFDCIEAAAMAPSSKNTQPWRFKIIRDDDIIDKLSQKSIVNPWLKRVRSLVIVYRYSDREDRMKDYLAIGAAIENFLLEAESNGVATCWIGSDDIIEFLKTIETRKNCEPVALIALGYGKNTEKITSNRLSMEEIIVMLY